jgi:tape measure domain-containing protein
MARYSATYDILLGRQTLSTGLRAADDDLDKTEGKIGKLNKSISNIGGGGSLLGSIVGGNLISGSISRIKDGIIDLGRHILDNTIKYQAYENSIMASARSEFEGARNIKFLNSEIKYLGLNVDAAYEGYKTFSGAMMGTSLQGDRGNKVFKELSEAMSVMHLSADQQKGSFLALGQMMSKGTVQAEELRGQLGERIPGAFQIAARAMKMSTQELGKFMQEGKLIASDFLPKFADEMEKTFHDKLPNALLSTQVELQKVNTQWENMFTNLGKSKTGVINFVIKTSGDALAVVNDRLENGNRKDEALKKYGGGYGFGSYLQYGLSYLSYGRGGDAMTNDNDFSGQIHKNYGTNENTTIGDAIKNIYTLTGKIKDITSDADFDERELTDEEKRHISILKYERDELVNFKKGYYEQQLHKNDKDGGMGDNGKSSTAGTGTTIEAGTPKNIYITINGGLVHQMTIESMDGDLPEAEIKEKVGQAFLELSNDVDVAFVK